MISSRGGGRVLLADDCRPISGMKVGCIISALSNESSDALARISISITFQHPFKNTEDAFYGSNLIFINVNRYILSF